MVLQGMKYSMLGTNYECIPDKVTCTYAYLVNTYWLWQWEGGGVHLEMNTEMLNNQKAELCSV